MKGRDIIGEQVVGFQYTISENSKLHNILRYLNGLASK